MNACLERLLERRNLTEREASEFLLELAGGEIPPAVAGAVLAALRVKGETSEELRGLARAMRELALEPELPPDARAVDVVGTGGDGSGSLNLSTGSALLAAAAGAPVVKHGNRSISSRCGSADVLGALGLALPLDEWEAGRCLRETGFTFLFAPHYHPAMKAVAEVRGALGVRTVFNLLGPLTNPGSPPFAVIGAFSPDAAELMARALAGLPIERAFVVHGAPGWDEPTPVGKFLLFEVRPGTVERGHRDPTDVDLPRCRPDDLAGGDAPQNARRLAAVLEGTEKGPHCDALLLGAGLALEVSGRAGDLAEGIDLARAAIEGGRGAELLERMDRFGKEKPAEDRARA